jgi:predicted nuclease of restriction endonuclease-like (RecB) superfamily
MSDYTELLEHLKAEIRAARLRATLGANAEMLLLYWKIGTSILEKETQAGWGKKIVEKLSTDLKLEFPDMQGISYRNLRYMKRFAKEYPDSSILQVSLAKLPWYHHITLLEKVKDPQIRLLYVEEVAKNGWTRDVMVSQIEANYHLRIAKVVNNFAQTMPLEQSEMARLTFKDPYFFDFINITEPFKERELEDALVKHITQFLLELGGGFSFVGRQYKIEISGREFALDLLFYHLKLRSYIVIELKKEEFKPEFAGKLNFYLSAVDDLLRHPDDAPSIGLIICKTKDSVMAEYALRDIKKPIGISEFKLKDALPDNLESTLPSIEEIEEQLSRA